jgi:hypothetical protein
MMPEFIIELVTNVAVPEPVNCIKADESCIEFNVLCVKRGVCL